MSLKYTNENGISVDTDILNIPKDTPIVLSQFECLKILKTANETIVQNPIDVHRITDMMEIAGELARYGIDASRVLAANLKARERFNATCVKNMEEST